MNLSESVAYQLGRADALLGSELKKFDPNQPRDAEGKFTSGANSTTANPRYDFTDSKQIGKVTAPSAKEWRQNPGDFTAAAHAAAHYAKRDNASMMVVPGNSHMRKVFHVVRTDDHTPLMGSQMSIAVVHPDGDIHQVVARRKGAADAPTLAPAADAFAFHQMSRGAA